MMSSFEMLQRTLAKMVGINAGMERNVCLNSQHLFQTCHMETSSHHHLPIFMNAAVLNILKDGFVKIDVDLRSLKETEPGNSRRGRGKKCRKQRYRDYYIEPNGCRSKKSFKMAKCVGSGSDSCVANKTKMRRIKFVCEDGRKFRKEVEIVKRCGKRRDNVWGR